MKAQTFVAGTSREALRRVKEALGPEAVILANRTVPGGVEMVALGPEAAVALAARHEPPGKRGADANAGSMPRSRRRLAVESATPAADARPHETVNQHILEEIKLLRGMVEEQLASLAWTEAGHRDPTRTRLLRLLLTAGFSAALARRVLEKLPQGRDFDQALKWVRAALALNVRTASERDGIVSAGGVYALVGPTGVGKTTTVAKIAARCVMKHGAQKVALLTTDTYRIGGHEQLRIYGRMLGVPVQAVQDAGELRLALSELKRRHIVLIDTAGVGQRDRVVVEQDSLLANAGAEVQRLLLLNATANGANLDDVVRAFGGGQASGCILTKLDEATHTGVVLDAAIRRGLKLHYVANGQKVPEDLHEANADALLEAALTGDSSASAFDLTEEQLPLVAAGLATVGGASGARHGAFRLKTGSGHE